MSNNPITPIARNNAKSAHIVGSVPQQKLLIQVMTSITCGYTQKVKAFVATFFFNKFSS
jgi:hypothetical protein